MAAVAGTHPRLIIADDSPNARLMPNDFGQHISSSIRA
jgi:hypothetical protein